MRLWAHHFSLAGGRGDHERRDSSNRACSYLREDGNFRPI